MHLDTTTGCMQAGWISHVSERNTGIYSPVQIQQTPFIYLISSQKRSLAPQVPNLFLPSSDFLTSQVIPNILNDVEVLV